MPVLRIEGKPNDYYGNREMCYYKNPDAVELVIRYVSRTRTGEKRQADLIAMGGCGIPLVLGVDAIIRSFCYVQDFNRISKRGGRRLYHEVYSFSDEDYMNLNCDIRKVEEIGRKICQSYYEQGFQSIYAIHYEPMKHLHIHIVVNAISFVTGKKYHASKEITEQKRGLYDSFYHVEMLRTPIMIQPIYFAG